ncbi:LysR family transcriptional regulator [Mesorhizobium sp. M0293]|uniref:LysR family transcriptional regulator n=1 Tax=Mesorhizobium sp. M0293 TaxID=2956930 RepID=UPI00333CB2E9
MNLSLRQVRYIATVADTGSIAAAARQCRIAHSSILAALSQAEAEAGARLFDRRPSRGVELTPAGDHFVASARRLLAAEAEFDRTLDRHTVGMPPVLRIGCFEPFGALFMPELLRRFTQGVDVEIELHEGEQPQLVDWLEANVVDAIVTYDIGPRLPDDATILAKVPAHALIRADDPLAQRSVVCLSELAQRPFILLDLPQSSAWLLALFDAAGPRPRIAFRTRSYETVRAAVVCGFGFSILNMKPIGRGSPDSDEVIRKPISDDVPVPRLMVADRYGAAKPLFLRRFTNVAQAFFNEVGPELTMARS